MNNLDKFDLIEKLVIDWLSVNGCLEDYDLVLDMTVRVIDRLDNVIKESYDFMNELFTYGEEINND